MGPTDNRRLAINSLRKRKVFLKGEKIFLSPLVKQDIPKWHNWFNDQDVTEYMQKGVFPNTVQKQKEFFENLYKDTSSLQLGIIHARKSELVGIIGLHKIDFVHRNADISIMIGEKVYYGKGLGAEALSLIIKHAFHKLNLIKLTGGMISTNTTTKKLFVKCGFKREGTFRNQFIYKGTPVDVYKYGLMLEDWLKKVNKV